MDRDRRALWFSSLAAGAALAVAGLYPVDNPDTYGHLAAGRQIAEPGRVPTLDTFSFFTREPRPFFNYEWLSDLAFYAIYAGGGERALTAFVALLLA